MSNYSSNEEDSNESDDCQDPTDKMISEYYDFVRNEKSNPVFLVAGNQRIKVDKKVMARRSTYFRAMIESKMKDNEQEEIHFDAFDGVGLRAVVGFVYDFGFRVDETDIIAGLNAAFYLQMEDMMISCMNQLSRMLEDSQFRKKGRLCAQIMNLGECYDLDYELHSRAKSFIAKNFTTLTDGERNMLSRKQFLLILGDTQLNVESEISMVNIVKEWMHVNLEVNFDDLILNVTEDVINVDDEPWAVFAEFFCQIRWPLVIRDDIGKHLDEKLKLLIEKIPKCQDLLKKAEEYQSNVEKQALMQTALTQVRSGQSKLITCNGGVYEAFNLHTKQLDESVPCVVNEKTVSFSKPGAVALDNFLYVLGGQMWDDSRYVSSKRSFRYDPRFNRWLELPPMVVARVSPVVVATATKLYILGGGEPTKTFECFNLETYKWSTLPDFFTDIIDHAACVVKNDIFIFGGRYDGNKISDQLYRYNEVDNTWTKSSQYSTSRGRYGHVMVNIGGYIYVIGGSNNKRFNTWWSEYNYMVSASELAEDEKLPLDASIDRYCAETDKWMPISQMKVTHTYYDDHLGLDARKQKLKPCFEAMNAQSYVIGDTMYIVGGSNNEGVLYSCVHSFKDSQLKNEYAQKEEVKMAFEIPANIELSSCVLMDMPYKLSPAVVVPVTAPVGGDPENSVSESTKE